MEIDNVMLWSIKPEEQPGWAAKRATLPKIEAVAVGKKGKKIK